MEKKRIKRFLTVYTVSYGTSYLSSGTTHVVTGSYFRRGDAIRECAALLLEKLGVYPEIRTSFLDDKNHEAEKALKEAGVKEDDVESFFGKGHSNVVGLEMPESVEKALMPYVKDVIGSDSCYRVKRFSFGQKDDLVEMTFDVDESDVESVDVLQAWTCITTGIDDEDHDPEFEGAYPQVFLCKDDAVNCAIDDLVQCLDGYEPHEKRTILAEAREMIAEHGHFEFDLNDSHQLRWYIWSTPVGIGQGSGKSRRP